MGALKSFLHLLNQVPRGQAVLLFVLMVTAAATEGIGLLLLVPLLGLIGPEAGDGGLVGRVMQTAGGLGVVPTVGGLLLVFLLLICLRSLVQYFRDQTAAVVERQLVDRYRHQAFSALLGAEWRWLAHSRRNDHANLLLSDVDRIGAGLQLGISLMATSATVLIYLLVALLLSPGITVFTMVNGVAVFWLLSSQRRRALALGYRQTETGRALHANVQESLAGIKLSKLLGSEGRHLALFEEDMRNMRDQYLAFLSSSQLSRALFQVGAAGLLVLYLYIGLTYASIPVAELLALTLLFSRMVPMAMGAQQLLYHWNHAMPALVSAEELLRDCRAAAEPPRAAAYQPWPLSEGIRLEAVSFTYPGRDRPALDEVSLSLPVRTTTAIVGASGSGKSSLADMLVGLLLPDAGSVLVDGIPLEGEARMRWRRSVSYVPQEPFLFHDSIRNNLLWGNPGADDADIADALSRAAAGFVLDLPEGSATVVGDAGMRLSGGERQRVALARALLRKPSLLILDEATSALDVENELRIRDALERLHGDLTVVIIGHRLATLEHADKVIRLDRGRVAACGRWSDLSRAGGVDS